MYSLHLCTTAKPFMRFSTTAFLFSGIVAAMASNETYYSVSTLDVKPENLDKVVEFFNKVSKATQELEPAAQIYKWYKVNGKDQFVYIEQYVNAHLILHKTFKIGGRPIVRHRFASEAAYRAHQNSSHVQSLYKEYLQYITEPFVFYDVDTSNRLVGGFERILP